MYISNIVYSIPINSHLCKKTAQFAFSSKITKALALGPQQGLKGDFSMGGEGIFMYFLVLLKLKP